MADMDKLWHFTKRYMMTGRINPQPKDYVSDLRNAYRITKKEKEDLIKLVRAWPGGNPDIINDTVIDISQA